MDVFVLRHIKISRKTITTIIRRKRDGEANKNPTLEFNHGIICLLLCVPFMFIGNNNFFAEKKIVFVFYSCHGYFWWSSQTRRKGNGEAVPLHWIFLCSHSEILHSPTWQMLFKEDVKWYLCVCPSILLPTIGTPESRIFRLGQCEKCYSFTSFSAQHSVYFLIEK